MDLSIPIIFLTGLFGYYLSDDERQRVQNVPQLEKSKEPTNKTIYKSNKVYEAEKQVYEKMKQNYVDSRDPENTNIIPPIYNTYGTRATHNLDVLGINDTKSISEYNERQRLQSIAQDGPESDIKSAPMFRSTVGMQLESQERKGKLYTDLENLGGQSVSLLTGEPLDQRHNNMVPFFGGTIKQNVEDFKNTSTLDRFTGEKDTHIKKHEIPSLQDKLPDNIYGSAAFSTTIESDRFIPSYQRTNEAPVERKYVSAPIANTLENDIRPVFRNVDELRVKNNPKKVYNHRQNHGQVASLRGSVVPVEKRRPDRVWDWGHSRLFVTKGDFTGHTSYDNFENMKHTNRPETNIEYFGGVSKKEGVEGGYVPNISDDTQSNGLTTVKQYAKRSNFEYGDNAFRNVHSDRNVGDYGKQGYNSQTVPATQRDSTFKTHVLNSNRQGDMSSSHYTDAARVTIKDQTHQQPYEIQGQVSSDFSSGQTGAVESGAADYQVKSNQKESTVENKYEQGIRHHDYGLGYVTTAYNVNTTNKEMTTNDPKSDYTGIAVGSEQYDPKSRMDSNNAEIRTRQEQLISNERIRGPQNFNINSGKDGFGRVKFDDNTLLSEKENTVKLNVESRKAAPMKEIIGKFDPATNAKRLTVEQGYQRMDSSIYNQLNDNVFYNNNLKAHIQNPVDFETQKNDVKKSFFAMQL